jgi:hypothetical protein
VRSGTRLAGTREASTAEEVRLRGLALPHPVYMHTLYVPSRSPTCPTCQTALPVFVQVSLSRFAENACRRSRKSRKMHVNLSLDDESGQRTARAWLVWYDDYVDRTGGSNPGGSTVPLSSA